MPKAHPITQEHSERNETGEPADQNEALNARDDARVVQFRLAPSHGQEDQVGEGEQGDYRAEDEEGD